MPVTVNPEHIREAFLKGYLDEHGTLDGAEGAWEWWRDPGLRCLQQIKPIKPMPRCKAPCPSCKIRRDKELQSGAVLS